MTTATASASAIKRLHREDDHLSVGNLESSYKISASEQAAARAAGKLRGEEWSPGCWFYTPAAVIAYLQNREEDLDDDDLEKLIGDEADPSKKTRRVAHQHERHAPMTATHQETATARFGRLVAERSKALGNLPISSRRATAAKQIAEENPRLHQAVIAEGQTKADRQLTATRNRGN